ncbi:MAG: cation transporter [Thermoleophilia bacterium]|nr:cation transporter [Thermoleophilia bacterium]
MHRHVHDHGDRLRGDRRRLAAALALVAAFMAVEVVAGLLADSLALLADAGHMLGDAASLGLALFAAWIAATPATPQRSFGYRRAEILAALANGAALVAIAIWIFVEAAARFRDPAEPLGGWIVVVGVLGIAVNLAAAAVIAGGRERSLNLQAAFRHVLADLAGSVGVVAAGVVVLTTGWRYADPVAAVAIGLLVVASSWSVLRDSVGVLLEATPRGVDAREVGRAMAGHRGVREVHDLHIWTITSGFPALSAHVLVDPAADCHAVRRELEGMLGHRFSLTHTTLQVEHAGDPAQRVALGEPYRRRGPLGRE